MQTRPTEHTEPRRPCQRCTFDMLAVHRSARLAKKPSMPVTERAQHNLCRKLGLTDDDYTPIEEVLREFMAMFRGPLPDNIVAALTTIFCLDDDDTDLLDEALLQHTGTAVAEINSTDVTTST
ncbi:hypothetical protein PVAP13_9KG227100 [Panicum virgatum]|uniref:Uncharacterized protein n=1 Tax=Panicum virgatum TaxID=38727 RepID=A0A8T0NPJ3_PANVG|nr:hypothetical protein PVAP13_9KG227100 [Panicum virgatum]